MEAVQENFLEGSGDIYTKSLRQGHCKSGARGQSFIASKGRCKLDQISFLLKILQWPREILTPCICDLTPFYVQNHILYHSSLSEIITRSGLLSILLTHYILSCLKMFAQVVPEARTVFCFFLLLFLGLAPF